MRSERGHVLTPSYPQHEAESLYIVGTGGFAREVAQLAFDLGKWRIASFVSNNPEEYGQTLGGYPILAEHQFLTVFSRPEDFPARSVAVAVALGNPSAKKRVVEQLRQVPAFHFPSLIHPSVLIGNRVSNEEGCILCARSVLTVDIHLEAFVTINLACTIGHDVVIGRYASLMPGVHLSGYVRVGQEAYLGVGAAVLEHKTVGCRSVVGAQAMVRSDLPIDGTYVGVPARLLEKPSPPSGESR